VVAPHREESNASVVERLSGLGADGLVGVVARVSEVTHLDDELDLRVDELRGQLIDDRHRDGGRVLKAGSAVVHCVSDITPNFQAAEAGGVQAVVAAATCTVKSYFLLAPTASVTTTETTTSLDAVAGAVRVTCEVVPVSDCPESVPPDVDHTKVMVPACGSIASTEKETVAEGSTTKADCAASTMAGAMIATGAPTGRYRVP